ncbi:MULTISPECIES: APC family permease [Micrococcaceae]|uniref:APC family permease n=1 Tax=Micrococcaceae TaxID=1268 RepID=UPI001035D9B2|nr:MULTISPECIES: APC family permease [Micrococcaceae]TAP28246.1 APC family permease [Arthrobacter sp. S41]UXN32956.1 APC family permease [Glutamicibacter sp. M10]
MSQDLRQDSNPAAAETGLHEKGLSKGTVGVMGLVVIGISSIAPAYTLTAGLGATVAEVGTSLPAILLAGFLPMLLVALGYRELNNAMPDSGTSFTWATRAFGPMIGWMGGWGLVAATVIVLSNLAAVAVDFFYILLAQLTGHDEIAELTTNLWINIPTTLIFIAVAAFISYRGMNATKVFQYGLVAFQVAVLLLFAVMSFTSNQPFDRTPITLEMFNPAGVESFSAFAAGISLSIFVFWGWDVTLTMNEETTDPKKVPGRGATWTVLLIMALYVAVSLGVLYWAGVGTTGLGAGNPENQESIFAVLSGPVMGPLALLMSLAILSSSAASLQSTMVSPARTLLAMGYYKALPTSFAKISPRFMSPSVATFVTAAAAAVFYVVTRLVSENALWDTITALGLMICFYYGLTALACVWYFRAELFSSARNVIFKFLAPLIGGVVLLVLFFATAFESMDPDYGSGSNIGGVGMVFILGVGVLLLGVVVMIYMRITQPSFFKGETIKTYKPIK